MVVGGKGVVKATKQQFTKGAKILGQNYYALKVHGTVLLCADIIYSSSPLSPIKNSQLLILDLRRLLVMIF